MKRVSRKVFVLAFVLVFFVLLSLWFFLLRTPTLRATGSGTAEGGTGWSTGLFSITGNVVEPISPGVMVPLDLSFSNHRDFEISITDLTVTISNVIAPNADNVNSCLMADFAIDQAPDDLRITLAAGATNSLSGLGLVLTSWPRMGMFDRPVDQDGCKGASLTLAYTASGTESPR